MNIPVSVKLSGQAANTTKATWECRLCHRSFKLPRDFPGEEKFRSVCADCVIIKLVEAFPLHRKYP